MEYVTHRRFRDISISGEVNLSAMTVCNCDGYVIKHGDKDICFATSENAHQYFAINEDGRGLERGKLTQAIQKLLAKRDASYQSRWDKVWDDTLCQQYKRSDHEDYWLWDHGFFNAPIEDLNYIFKLIGGKKV